MEEKHLKVFSVLGALASLLAVCLFVTVVESQTMNICEVDPSVKSTLVTVKGIVTEVVHIDGNVFFTLEEDGCEIDVVIWEDMATSLTMKGTDPARIGVNETLEVTGEVGTHSGKLQIVPKRPELSIGI